MQSKQPKFYRLLECPTPNALKQQSLNKQFQDRQETSPQKLTEQIIKNKHYVYIDINSKSGLCQMQSINPEDVDNDAQAIAGNNIVCSINKLPIQSQKTIDYIYKLQEAHKQKDKFRQLLRDHINTTIMRRKDKYQQQKKRKKVNKTELNNKKAIATQNSPLKRTQQSQLNKNEPKLIPRSRNLSLYTKASQNNLKLTVQSPKQSANYNSLIANTKIKNSVVIYRGMQTKYLKSYLQQKQYNEINAKILEKQKFLIQKYGFTNQFQSMTKQKSQIVRRHRKVYLPYLKSADKFTY